MLKRPTSKNILENSSIESVSRPSYLKDFNLFTKVLSQEVEGIINTKIFSISTL